MRSFGLGDFAGQLKMDELNGALGKLGTDYRVGSSAPAPAPAPQQPQPQAMWQQLGSAAAMGSQAGPSEEEKAAQKKKALMSTALSLVGAYFTGGASLAAGGAGGAAGGLLGGLMGGKK